MIESPETQERQKKAARPRIAANLSPPKTQTQTKTQTPSQKQKLQYDWILFLETLSFVPLEKIRIVS